MAITLVNIDQNDAIANAPAILNQNFDTIASHIDDLEELLSPVSKTIKLTNLTTIPANSIEAESLVLTKSSGLVMVVSPGGGAAVASLDVNGIMSVFKIVASGIGDANKSVLQDLEALGASSFQGASAFGNLVSLVGADSRLATKSRRVNLTDANMGETATNPIDVSKDNILMLDYSGVTIVEGIKFDLTNMVEGQELTLILLRNAAGGTQALHNGTTGNEIYAYINPATTGFVTISSATRPQFTPAASPNQLSIIKVKWMNVGSGTFRLVVIDSKQATGVA
jgi:hypothetical protein